MESSQNKGKIVSFSLRLDGNLHSAIRGYVRDWNDVHERDEKTSIDAEIQAGLRLRLAELGVVVSLGKAPGLSVEQAKEPKRA